MKKSSWRGLHKIQTLTFPPNPLWVILMQLFINHTLSHIEKVLILGVRWPVQMAQWWEHGIGSWRRGEGSEVQEHNTYQVLDYQVWAEAVAWLIWKHWFSWALYLSQGFIGRDSSAYRWGLSNCTCQSRAYGIRSHTDHAAEFVCQINVRPIPNQ